MESGRLYSKEQTVTHGTNLSNSGTHAYKHVEIPTHTATTSNNLEYSGEDDSQKVMSGAGGDTTSGADDATPVRWGYVAPSGSRLEVNDSGGSERLDMVHHTGSGVTVEPDGAGFFVSQSKRGLGISAPFGDLFITAGGDITINGTASLSVKTTGDLNLDVGGMFNLRCQDYKVVTKSSNVTIDGPSVTNVTNDESTVIGGLKRLTVAGDMREQVSQRRVMDTGGNQFTRIGGALSHDVTGKAEYKTGGEQKTSVGGAHSISSGASSKISATGDNEIYAGGDSKLTAGGTANVKAGGPVKLDGSVVNASPYVDLAKWADETQQAAFATTLGGSVGAKPSVQGAASGSAGEVSAPSDAQVMESNDIVDTLTSARKYPNYPGNGVTESANATGYGTISYDETPEAEDVMNEYSGGNQGNINPSQEQESYDNLPEDPTNRSDNITAVDPGKAPPSQHDLGAKISKYFTLGQLTRAKHSHPIPPSQYDQIVKQHILLANNVLDPIKEKFPDLVITSAYRSNSSNHRTGRAIDIVVESRSMAKHAEIARFARDNLPVDQVFIEKNTSGRTHVHLRVSAAGAKGNPSVLTCGDPKCRSRVAGINVTWLGRRAV